jgi:Zn-dependent peptidase ImmA (M78 family)
MSPRLYRPNELLQELGITEPEEIELEVIAQYVGATVVAEPLTGAEARLVGSGDKAIITVNANSSLPRQRFSAGHELGHWMHDRGRPQFSCGAGAQNASFLGSDPESLANRYATELLLPDYMVKPRLGKKAPILATVEELAGVFTTSLTATTLRIVDLGMWPSMVVCYSKDTRQWFKRGRDVPDNVWPLRALSEDSAAFVLLRDPNGSSATEEVDADAWIDLPDAGDYTVIESSFKVTPELVVSLLWWKDQAQLEALDER